jgi:hypothetical protein
MNKPLKIVPNKKRIIPAQAQEQKPEPEVSKPQQQAESNTQEVNTQKPLKIVPGKATTEATAESQVVKRMTVNGHIAKNQIQKPTLNSLSSSATELEDTRPKISKDDIQAGRQQRQGVVKIAKPIDPSATATSHLNVVKAKPVVGAANRHISPTPTAPNINMVGSSTVATIPEPYKSHILNYETELTLGDVLCQGELITMEQFTEVSKKIKARKQAAPNIISRNILVELHKLDNVPMAEIIGFITENSANPFIDISRFKLTPHLTEKLPLNITENLGVLVISSSDKYVSIGCVNSLDIEMQEIIQEMLAGLKVFFFQISPRELINFYDKQRINS